MSQRIKPGTKVIVRGFKKEFVVSHFNKEENIATLIAYDKNQRFYNVEAALCLLEAATPRVPAKSALTTGFFG